MSRKRIIVVRMQRLPLLQHDKIRHIDNIIDAANIRTAQRILQPFRRRRNFHIAQKSRRKAFAKIGGGKRHFCVFRNRRTGLVHLNGRQAQLTVEQRRKFTSQSHHAETVRSIRCKFKLENHIIET